MAADAQRADPETSREPPVEDRDSAEWWEALRRHELVLQRCNQCAQWRWPARAICGACGSFEWGWHAILPTGTVVSWITTHHTFLPSYRAPYHSVLIRPHLAVDAEQHDILMPGSWLHSEPPFTGQVVTARFDDMVVNGEHATLLGWAPREV